MFLIGQVALAQESEHIKLSANILDDLRGGRYKEVMAMLDTVVFTKMDTTHIRLSWESVNKSAGKFVKVDSVSTAAQPPFEVVVQKCKFEKKYVNFRLIWSKNNKVKGMYFIPVDDRPPYKNPSYFNPASFQEKKVLVSTGNFRLPGTLTIPNTPGKHPVVILIHGAGSNDRDETMGPTKIFRDMAAGFAAKGIATLRYEKRSRVFKSRIQHQKVFTVRDETLDDIPAALEVVCKDTAIDTTNIYLIGHSFGGFLLPRIVKDNPKVKGLIYLAPNGRKLEDVFVDQTEYILSVTNQSPEFVKHVMDSVKAVQSKIHGFTNSSYNDSALFFEAPPAYWIDLHNYNAIKAASELSQPMLFLYGLRDYQSTNEDVTLWQSGLKAKTNAEFKIYPKLNHFFIAGEGKSTPTEYEKPGNVDESVINDIAAWISGKGK